jgi:hypothetical protein
LVVGIAMTTGVVVSGDGDRRPLPAPSPSSPFIPSFEVHPPFRGEPVEVTPPADAREHAQRMRVISSHQNEPGEPRLSVEVSITDTYSDDILYCQGAPGTWLVAQWTDDETPVTTPCDAPAGSPPPQARTLPFLGVTDILLFDPRRTLNRAFLFVTTVDPATGGLRALEAGTPSTTTAEFGLVLYRHSSPTVGTIVGEEVSVLGEVEGRDRWFVRGVEAATAAESLTVELPATSVERLVQVVVHHRRIPRASLTLYVDGEEVEHRVGHRGVLLVDQPAAFIPADGSHTLEVRVTEGDPEAIDFGLAIFEAD